MPGSNLYLQDALLTRSVNLMAGGSAGATVATSPIDLQNGTSGQFNPQRVSFKLEIPALTVTQLPNSTSVTYSVHSSDFSDGSSSVPLYNVPTGSVGGTSGSPAVVFNFTPPPTVYRYLLAKATGSASTSATSAVMKLSAVF